MKKGSIIQASSRSTGNTSKVVGHIQNLTGFDVIDLNTKNIGHFDYNFKNEDDDYNKLFKKITTNYDLIIFATPVYWYTMSGLLKVFFDRISDFLRHEKEYGRMLRGKEMAVISCTEHNEIFNHFETPFTLSAQYLGMNYLGYLHTWIENGIISQENKINIQKFLTNKLKIKD